MSHPARRRSLAIVAGAAIVGGALLSGCGRKTGLDPPPTTALPDERAIAAQSASGPEPRPNGQASERAPATFARTPLDWLID